MTYGFRALAPVVLGLGVLGACAKRVPSGPPVVELVLDTAKTPDIRPWAEQAKAICEAAFPLIVEALDPDLDALPRRVDFEFVTRVNPSGTWVGEATKDSIRAAAPWFAEHPDDVGALVHELSHVVQGYFEPTWLSEGIADYVRWFLWEPPARRPHFDVAHKTFYEGYQVVAEFLDWLVRTKDPALVRKVNRECQAGRYRYSLWAELTGTDLDGLWKAYQHQKAQPVAP